jgi:hypothetical protein
MEMWTGIADSVVFVRVDLTTVVNSPPFQVGNLHHVS